MKIIQMTILRASPIAVSKRVTVWESRASKVKAKKQVKLKRCVYSREVVGFRIWIRGPVHEIWAHLWRLLRKNRNFRDFRPKLETDLLWGSQAADFDEWPLSRCAIQERITSASADSKRPLLTFWRAFKLCRPEFHSSKNFHIIVSHAPKGHGLTWRLLSQKAHTLAVKSRPFPAESKDPHIFKMSSSVSIKNLHKWHRHHFFAI